MKAFKTMCLALGILTTVCFSGCILPDLDIPYRNEEREVGDFVVWFYDDYCEIKGTTEQGNNNRFLVVPEYLEGIRVKSFGYSTILGGLGNPSQLTYPEIESDALEKIYFESAIEVYPFLENKSLRPNLQKIMYPAIEHGRGICGNVYYPRSLYEKALQIGDEMYITEKSPANVSYFYNYENANNDGYYFIDDCDYGGKIEYIPSAPLREGYTFGGWYKEEECLNKWDFETDTLPEEKTELKEGDFDEYEYGLETVEIVVYQETILYAKWIEEV